MFSRSYCQAIAAYGRKSMARPMPRLVLVVLTAIPLVADAAVVTFIYQGTIVSQEGPVADLAPLSIGDEIIFSVTYDTEAGPSFASIFDGTFFPLVGMKLETLGRVTIAEQIGGTISVSNDDLFGQDTFGGSDFRSALAELTTGPALGGLIATGLFFEFQDSTATAFDAVALPTVAPDPADFDPYSSTSVTLAFQEPPAVQSETSSTFGIRVDSVVPVPAAAWLFGSSLGLLILRRRKVRSPARRFGQNQMSGGL